MDQSRSHQTSRRCFFRWGLRRATNGLSVSYGDRRVQQNFRTHIRWRCKFSALFRPRHRARSSCKTSPKPITGSFDGLFGIRPSRIHPLGALPKSFSSFSIWFSTWLLLPTGCRGIRVKPEAFLYPRLFPLINRPDKINRETVWLSWGEPRLLKKWRKN